MSESNKSAETKKSAEQVEQERLTRRQALRKLGFGAGLSAVMLLGADDLARMVGRRMEQMAGDSKVAEQIAKEFRSAGVALAGGGGGTVQPSCVKGTPCDSCCVQLRQNADACTASYVSCQEQGKPADVCKNGYNLCSQGMTDQYSACTKKNNCNCACPAHFIAD